MSSPIDIALLLKGRLQIENKVKNGDFANGTSGWSFSDSTSGTVDGSVMTITNSASDARGAWQSITGDEPTYLAFEVKSELTITQVNLGNGPMSVTATPGDWNRYSRVQTLTGITRFYANSQNFYLRYPTCVKLTSIFGSGNEPTVQEMDELIKILGGWFGGKITVTQKQLAIWLLNLMRQNRNAITALGGTIT